MITHSRRYCRMRGGVPAGGRDLGCLAAGEGLPAVLQLGKALDVIRLAEGDLDTGLT